MMLPIGAAAAADACRRCMDGKAKPPGSLATLEDISIRLATLQRTLKPRVAGARLLLFAADHGVTSAVPAVSAYPRSVTPAMFGAISRGQAASSVLAAENDCGVILVDVGIDADVAHLQPPAASRTTVLHRKVACGTQAFHAGPAMTQQQLQAAMAAGAEAVALACTDTAAEAAAAGSAPDGWLDSQCVICVGELGIGNTTSASALLAALCSDATPGDVCGRGTGVDAAGLQAKQQVVKQALKVNQDLISSGPLGALQAVGGLELAAMAGAYLAAAQRGMPVVVDGFISGAAALAALRHDPVSVQRCLFVSHQSAETGAQRLLQELGGGSPPLQLGLRLGEGTGAVLMLPLLRSAAAIMRDMVALEDVLAAAN